MYPRLRALGVPSELSQMPYGDVSWLGSGVDGAPVSVGIEMKSLHDCLQCIGSGRFAGHQLPGLVQSFDYVWLMVEGDYRGRTRDGVLEYYRRTDRGAYWTEAGGGRRQWMARDFEAWLLSMVVMGGIRVIRVADWDSGAQWIKTAYNWFQKETHSSHLAMYSGKVLAGDSALLTKPSLVRRVAAELPGVGFKRSAKVAARFRSVSEMVSAPVSEWLEVEGIGAKTAQGIVKAVHGGNGNGNSGGE